MLTAQLNVYYAPDLSHKKNPEDIAANRESCNIIITWGHVY